ncbi:nicotinate-nucleotide--dimethylbenzimidazole phosphoribosyltransferase [Xanthovirga aplysinae]|uniref:nicotinate-nucleotide--dimethylbenzimidazole phosphoribosyltransferase n=1 Tax=Xanthovirga aplysinae TaxID=2529853 RepID=UPI0012BBD14F|nr:nicotinate-nucleotide--dimethylbenzimidazole phosphoribosyltransferase [Xanthovirga aplysinae]MTI31004.1 nicotinate-nucleotide--dimethylbenzimidazole phosphoribosyltransferase [Xanthovirga aplysinae]
METLQFNIKSPDQNLKATLQQKIDHKTKPIGALGQLEVLAMQIGLVQQTESPQLNNPTVVVFAADHGIAKEGVSAYPQEVTYQMVMNFLQEGAAINVFCQQNGLGLKVVDAGVNYDFPEDDRLISAKIGYGTKSFMWGPAMTEEECLKAIQSGRKVVRQLAAQGCNVIGFGEMGIGNTSSASLMMSLLCNMPLENCVGKGTGVDPRGLGKKLHALKKSLDFHGPLFKPLKILQTFGGFEIAQMFGAILEAAEQQMLILVDGFIATAAFISAYKMYPQIKHYAVFCHQSDEKGHARMLEYLQVRPVLKMDMRLGEGTGAALAYPLIQSAVCFLNEMASFESAGVSTK